MLRLHAQYLSEKAEAAGDKTNIAIAVRTGVRESTISRLMTGRTTPSLATLAALAAAYDTTLDDLVVGLAARVPAQRAEAT